MDTKPSIHSDSAILLRAVERGGGGGGGGKQGKLPRASGCKGASGSRKYYSYNWGVEGIIIKCDGSAADPEGGGGGGGG